MNSCKENQEHREIDLLDSIINECGQFEPNDTQLEYWGMKMDFMLDSKNSFSLNQLRGIVRRRFSDLVTSSGGDKKSLYEQISCYTKTVKEILENDYAAFRCMINKVDEFENLSQGRCNIIRGDINLEIINLQCCESDPALPDITTNIKDLEKAVNDFLSEINMLESHKAQLAPYIKMIEEAEDVGEQRMGLSYLRKSLDVIILQSMKEEKISFSAVVLDNRPFFENNEHAMHVYDSAREKFNNHLRDPRNEHHEKCEIDLTNQIIAICEKKGNLAILNALRVELYVMLDSKSSRGLHFLQEMIEECFSELSGSVDPNQKEYFYEQIKYYAGLIKKILEFDSTNFYKMTAMIESCNKVLECQETIISHTRKNMRFALIKCFGGIEFPATPGVDDEIDELEIAVCDFFRPFMIDADLKNLENDVRQCIKNINDAPHIGEQRLHFDNLINYLCFKIASVLNEDQIDLVSSVITGGGFFEITGFGKQLCKKAENIFGRCLQPLPPARD